MQLSDLQLNRFLYRTQPQTVETLGSDAVASNINPAPSTAIASGNTVVDINTNAQQLDGIVIAPGTIPPATLDVSNWGWTQTCVFTAATLNTVTWLGGTFTSANGVSYTISAGTTGVMAAKTYIYLDINVSETVYQVSTTITAPVGLGKVLIAVAENGASLSTYILVQATQIVGDNILANTIAASKITTGQLIVGTNVGLGTAQDSAGVTTIIGNTVTTGFVNALSVVAGSVAAENITGTTITGKTLQTSASGERIEILASTKRLNLINSSGSTVASLNYGASSATAILTLTPTNDSRGSVYITQLSGNSSTTVDIASAGTGQLMRLFQSNTSNSSNVLDFTNKGTGLTFAIDTNSATSGNHSLYITARPDNASYTNASAIYVDLDASSSGAGMTINDVSTSLGIGLNVIRTAASGSATLTGQKITLTSLGVGYGLDIVSSSPNTGGYGMRITHTGDVAGVTYGMKITSDNNTGTPGGIDLSSMSAAEPVFKVVNDTGSIGAQIGRIAIAQSSSGTIYYIPYYAAA